MKVRKKPVIVDAVQYADGSYTIAGLCYCSLEMLYRGPHIHTLEGMMRVSVGDWIVTGVKGEKYPVRPDIFAETYEIVNDNS